jgi:hypothetical protein
MTQILSDRDRRQGDSNTGWARGDFKYQANGQESVCAAHEHVCIWLLVCVCVWIVEMRTRFHSYRHQVFCTGI